MNKSGFHNKYLIGEFYFLVSWVGRVVECIWQKYEFLANVTILKFEK